MLLRWLEAVLVAGGIMGLLPSLLSLLLVAAAGGDRHVDAAAGTGETTVPYMSASEVAAYWQRACPNSAMPSAILHHLSSSAVEGHQSSVHEGSHNHHHIGEANICFSEDKLAPGSTVTPYILPAASNAPFLRHEVAKSIQMSVHNFTDIVRKFAPVSHKMARGIRTTLEACKHPVLLDGEQQGCATSMESMVKLATAMLGTRDVLALSSSASVPAEGLQSAPRDYTVVSARTVAGKEIKSMTCHGSAFPFAVFYCHYIDPTRVYEVTLRRRRSTAAEEGTMRVLAVCFVEQGLMKPGDIPLCHYLSRDTVLWIPATAPPQQAHQGLLMVAQ